MLWFKDIRLFNKTWGHLFVRGWRFWAPFLFSNLMQGAGQVVSILKWLWPSNDLVALRHLKIWTLSNSRVNCIHSKGLSSCCRFWNGATVHWCSIVLEVALDSKITVGLSVALTQTLLFLNFTCNVQCFLPNAVYRTWPPPPQTVMMYCVFVASLITVIATTSQNDFIS